MGEGPGGHSHLAGRAGRNLEGRHAEGKNLGTSRIACPLTAFPTQSSLPPPIFFSRLTLPPAHPGGPPHRGPSILLVPALQAASDTHGSLLHPRSLSSTCPPSTLIGGCWVSLAPLGSPEGRGQRHLSIPCPSCRIGRVEASGHACHGSGTF